MNNDNRDVNDHIFPPATVNLLTMTELEAMPLGSQVINREGITYLKTNLRTNLLPRGSAGYAYTGYAIWFRSDNALHGTDYLSAFEIIPLHLSARELDNLPDGTMVMAENRLVWTVKTDRIWRASGDRPLSAADLAWRRIDRRTVLLPSDFLQPEPQPNLLTETELEAMHLGSCIVDGNGNVSVCIRTDPSQKWITSEGVRFAARGLAAIGVKRLYLSADELKELPVGSAVTSASGVEWFAEHKRQDGTPGWFSAAKPWLELSCVKLARQRMDRRTIVLPPGLEPKESSSELPTVITPYPVDDGQVDQPQPHASDQRSFEELDENYAEEWGERLHAPDEWPAINEPSERDDVPDWGF